MDGHSELLNCKSDYDIFKKECVNFVSNIFDGIVLYEIFL
jgi:hypothetical protein